MTHRSTHGEMFVMASVLSNNSFQPEEVHDVIIVSFLDNGVIHVTDSLDGNFHKIGARLMETILRLTGKIHDVE